MIERGRKHPRQSALRCVVVNVIRDLKKKMARKGTSIRLSSSRISSSLLLSMFATFASFYVAGRLVPFHLLLLPSSDSYFLLVNLRSRLSLCVFDVVYGKNHKLGFILLASSTELPDRFCLFFFFPISLSYLSM